MQRLALLLGLSLIVLPACSDTSSKDDETTDSDGIGDGDGDQIGDGDGDGDDGGNGDGDGEVYCDLTSLPQQEPIWLQALPADRNGSVIAPGLAVTPDAIFSGGLRVASGESPDAAFITRRDLDGQVQWTVDLSGFNSTRRSVQWDGLHVYYLTDGDEAGIRRMTADGQVDGSWSYSDDDLSIVDLDVSGARVLVGAREATINTPDYEYYDAVTISIDKTNSSIKATETFGEPYTNEHVTAVAPWRAGGHISALRGEYNDLFLRGYYSDAMFNIQTPFLENPVASFMHERPDGLLVTLSAQNDEKWGMWLLMVNLDGSESWRKPLAPCGEFEAVFGSVAVGPEHVFAVAWVEVSHDLFTGVIIEFGFDGELLTTHALAGAPEGRLLVRTIATNGEAVVVSGSSVVAPGDLIGTGWVARIH